MTIAMLIGGFMMAGVGILVLSVEEEKTRKAAKEQY